MPNLLQCWKSDGSLLIMAFFKSPSTFRGPQFLQWAMLWHRPGTRRCNTSWGWWRACSSSTATTSSPCHTRRWPLHCSERRYLRDSSWTWSASIDYFLFWQINKLSCNSGASSRLNGQDAWSVVWNLSRLVLKGSIIQGTSVTRIIYQLHNKIIVRVALTEILWEK